MKLFKSVGALALFFLLLVGLLTVEARAGSGQALKALPIQDGGRLKPFDTFARESLQLITGKRSLKDLPATDVVFSWIFIPDYWLNEKFVRVDRWTIKQDLKLDVEAKYFSPQEILASDRFPLLMQDLQSRRAAKEKLDPHFQAAQNLENQLGLFRAISSGQALRFIPPVNGDQWLAVGEATEEIQRAFAAVSQAFVSQVRRAGEAKDEAAQAGADGDHLARAVAEFVEVARAANPQLYPPSQMIQVEVFLNAFEPFMWSWVLYLLALIFLAMAWSGKRRWAIFAMWSAVGLGFLMHTFGFALRVYITGRPPVSNMYETVVWVAWGAIFFGTIMELIYRRRHILATALAVGILGLIVADLAPTVLDPSLQPLQPVLRSNFWLTVHVLTITISYAAFFLAFALGDFGLLLAMRGSPHQVKARLREIANSSYRAIQIGVVLLAAGIILGGVWADYSWGRFWGWDPKETWSFIALMGYLAILHGRLAGLIADFGMLVTSVIAFSLVLMSWYGVNFVLGAGLHSYGFGAGGVEYVTGFVVIHFIVVAVAVYLWVGKTAHK